MADKNNSRSRLRHFSVVLAVVLAATGCASKLQVIDEDKVTPLPGIPVGAPEPFEIRTTRKYQAIGSPPAGCDLTTVCIERTTSEVKFFPLGRTYYVNFDAAAFAKSEFALKFAESGVLTEVTLNSTPNADAVTGVLDAILPYTVAPKAAPPGVEGAPPQVQVDGAGAACPIAATELFKQYCLEASSEIKIIRIAF